MFKCSSVTPQHVVIKEECGVDKIDDDDDDSFLDHEENIFRCCGSVDFNFAWDIVVGFLQQSLHDIDFNLNRAALRIEGYIFETIYAVAYAIEFHVAQEVLLIIQLRHGPAFTLTNFINTLRDALQAAGVLPYSPPSSDSDDEFLTPETTSSSVFLEFNPMFDPDIVYHFVRELSLPSTLLPRARTLLSQLAYFSTFPGFKPKFSQATDDIIPPVMKFLQTSTDLILNRGCVKILLCILTSPFHALQFCQLGYLSVLCSVLRRWSGIERKPAEHEEKAHFAQEYEHEFPSAVAVAKNTVYQFIAQSRTVCFIITQCLMLILTTLSRNDYGLFREQDVTGKLQTLLTEATFDPEIRCSIEEIIGYCALI